MKYEVSTSARNEDINPMRNVTENRQNDLQSAESIPKIDDEFSHSNRTDATADAEDVKGKGRKSTFAYLFIAAGLLACLAWSSTLLWLLMRALTLLVG